MSEIRGWIGVDLDGTLAHYDGWHGETHIGQPVAKMVGHVKTWLEHGHYDVKVFTARVSTPDAEERAAVERAIHAWCEEHIGQRLEVVCAKDYAMVQLWDDRAAQVLPNTGVSMAEALETMMQARDSALAALAAARADHAKMREELTIARGDVKRLRRAAQRMAEGIRLAVKSRQLDARSPAADALLDYDDEFPALDAHLEETR
ncbi:MAG: hypothetical protein ACYC3L_01170 [Gemmatimonadaceae bacterium]